MLDLIYKIGALICHQLPQRSLFLQYSSVQYPLLQYQAIYYQSFVCARDIGIYFGIFLGLLFLLAMKQNGRPLSPEPSLPMMFFFLPLAIDGTTSYLGLQPSSNLARIWTGLFFGIGLLFLLASIASRNKETAPICPRTYIMSFLLTFLATPLFFLPSPLLFTFLNTVSFITFLGLIATLVFLASATINESIKNTWV